MAALLTHKQVHHAAHTVGLASRQDSAVFFPYGARNVTRDLRQTVTLPVWLRIYVCDLDHHMHTIDADAIEQVDRNLRFIDVLLLYKTTETCGAPLGQSSASSIESLVRTNSMDNDFFLILGANLLPQVDRLKGVVIMGSIANVYGLAGSKNICEVRVRLRTSFTKTHCWEYAWSQHEAPSTSVMGDVTPFDKNLQARYPDAIPIGVFRYAVNFAKNGTRYARVSFAFVQHCFLELLFF